jgi:hypothetical protein
MRTTRDPTQEIELLWRVTLDERAIMKRLSQSPAGLMLKCDSLKSMHR